MRWPCKYNGLHRRQKGEHGGRQGSASMDQMGRENAVAGPGIDRKAMHVLHVSSSPHCFEARTRGCPTCQLRLPPTQLEAPSDSSGPPGISNPPRRKSLPPH